MARRRSGLRDTLEYAAFRLLLGTLAIPPLALAYQLGSFYAGALDRIVPRLRRVAYDNLAMAFPG